jgi:exodeoxyribonuclease VII small subunit
MKKNELESSLEKLEKIVKELENGKMSLEESIGVFEEGISLYKKCKDAISGLEKKISVLNESLKEEDVK